MMIRGSLIRLDPELYKSYDKEIKDMIDASIHFRANCEHEGFILSSLYPIYYQGWEMDEWGAIGNKDGEEYLLETNHGYLTSIKLSEVDIKYKLTPMLYVEHKSKDKLKTGGA